MYKVASDKRQTSLHHGAGLKDWIGGGEENLTLVERQQNLIRAINNVEKRKQDESDPKERKALGIKKLEIQGELSKIKAQLKLENTRNYLTNRTFEECFIEIAREQLMPAQFKALMSAAERLKKQYAAEASAVPRPDGAKP